MNNLIGQSLGRYHITEKLGEGGMATVYKAFDTRLERDVAVKIIRKEAFSQELIGQMLKRFEREAKTLAKLTHPNIVPIIDYGEYESSLYLVMPYLAGGTLKQLMGKPMAWQSAIRLLLPISKALAYAHEQDVIHRDVKPANILMTTSGEPMLTDFGIAKMLDLEDGQTLTGTGVGIGTPEYMAPEQGMGKKIDGRADIYSLGIIFFELLTGKKPFTADTPMAVVFKHMTDPLPQPGAIIDGLPDSIEKVIYKALAKDPSDRYLNMGELAAAFKKLENSTPDDKTIVTSFETLVPQTANERDPYATINQLEATINYPPKLVNQTSNSTSSSEPQKIPVKFEFSFGKIFGLSLVGVVLLMLIIGVASGWFKTKVVPTAAPPAPDAGTTMISPKDGMVLVYVPAGDFLMGSLDGVGEDDEHPQHSVTLDGYWIDQTEVTNAMYEQCVNDGGCTKPSSSSSYTRNSYYGSLEYADYPVIYVDWDQANGYCQWAGRRLPTEAEWEKAARGEVGQTYPWTGEEANNNLANYNLKEGDTTKVGSYPDGASPYGALDMAGNVWEWVSDRYGSYPSGSVNSPQGPTTGDGRVLRSGSWCSYEDNFHSADRLRNYPSNTSYSSGFRCAYSQ
ncbi:MAG: hypothetical protein C0410_03730 [Anaerolinea sp.]|nr:hypothetical protein [Anaerolinea sp.]